MERDPLDSGALVSDPLALIRSRIEEKRLHEARFLFRRIGSDIDPGVKAVLERELTSLFEQVEAIRQRARNHVARGESESAGRLYEQLAAMIVDLPGLAEERTRLAGSASMVSDIAAQRRGRRAEEPGPVTPMQPTTGGTDRGGVKRRAGLRRLWLAVGCSLLVLALLLVLARLFGTGTPRSAPPHTLTPPERQSVGDPVVPALPAIGALPKIGPDQTPVAGDQAASSLKLAPLEIRESAGQ